MTGEGVAARPGPVLDELLQGAFEHGLIPTCILGADSRHVLVNDAYCKLVGYGRQELVGTALADLVLTDDKEATERVIALIRSGTRRSAVVRLHYVHVGGAVSAVEANFAAVAWKSPEAHHVVVHAVDVTQALDDARGLEEAERLLQYLADHDPLTGLLNRRAFSSLLEEQVEMVRVGRRNEQAALLMIDLDGFKRHNDTFGHQAGDEVLVSVSEALHNRLREADMIGRLGGDELAVLLPGTSAAEAERVAADLVHVIARAAAAGEHDSEHPVTASIGVTDFRNAPDVDTVVARADAALYDVKHRGRNGYAVRL